MKLEKFILSRNCGESRSLVSNREAADIARPASSSLIAYAAENSSSASDSVSAA